MSGMSRCRPDQVTAMRLNPSLDVLAARLQRYGGLPPQAHTALCEMPSTFRTLEPGSYIVREADAPVLCAVLLSGFAYRQKVTGRGDRQIVSLCVPGDIVDLQNLYLDLADHSVQMLTAGDAVTFRRDALQTLACQEPSIGRAIMIEALIEASILREWVTNIGQRNAKARVAHLICESAVRLSATSPSDTFEYDLPMNQEHLGDALGLTAVHVNRMLKALQSDELIKQLGRFLSVPSMVALMDAGEYNPRYLHLPQANF
ncbi:MAG: Crp/Fnr family transcriptional regulator [Oxalobacteraceae bacterium]|nr:MAG: Crp/Fnr family transcriptional regulator [Oxalobacteraceae bacterium]